MMDRVKVHLFTPPVHPKNKSQAFRNIIELKSVQPLSPLTNNIQDTKGDVLKQMKLFHVCHTNIVLTKGLEKGLTALVRSHQNLVIHGGRKRSVCRAERDQ